MGGVIGPEAGPSDAIGGGRSWEDRYLLLLLVLLAGYAAIGKGFAYIGYPPLFIGESVLLCGTVIFIRMNLVFACVTTLPAIVLAVMMAWTLARTLPFVASYGFDAPRDSVLIMYGAFSFIVIALLLHDGRRLGSILDVYRRFLAVFLPVLPILFFLSQYAKDWPPDIPGTEVRSILIGAGEAPVHLAGAAVFAMAGFYRPSILALVGLVSTLLMASSLNRGGMLAFLIPVLGAAILLGKFRALALVLVSGIALFAVAYTAERVLTDPLETAGQTVRQVRPSQFVANIQSIAGQHTDEKLEGSRRWRLQWWDIILDDTIRGGPHFWNGRGYGLNLAVADGYGGGRTAHPLRSPHNVHMTILARAGVTGLALWLLFLIVWFGTMGAAYLHARLSGEQTWAGLFLFIACYTGASLINATFDVALEGPMQGIWFWCLVGFGIGSVMIFRFTRIQPLLRGRSL